MDLSLQTDFYSGIKTLIEKSRIKVYEDTNLEMIQTYWQIGKQIFEEEQRGSGITGYGELLIENLESQLAGEFGKGFDRNNLAYMRRFFLTFPMENTLRPVLSWSHYRLIMNVEEEQAHFFYMNKTADSHWSVQQLTQQIESKYYTSSLSDSMKELENEELLMDELQCKSSDLFRDPYLLEFLDFKPVNVSLKHELEQAVLDKIHDFLLEIANGFCLVSRQKHNATEQNEHYHIDLVFYNYLLRCFVIINLRLGKITEEDEQILDRYVQMYDDKIRPKDDNPTFGILICSHNGETEVKFASLNDRKHIFSSLYQLVIPSKEDFTEVVTTEIQHQISENQLLEKYLWSEDNA